MTFDAFYTKNLSAPEIPIQTNEGGVYNGIVYCIWETFDTIYCYTYFSISFNWDESAKHPTKLKKSF